MNFFVRLDNRYVKINADDIYYIVANGSYLEIVTSKRNYALSRNLAQFMKKNEWPSLVRVHRSYIVNIEKVDSIDQLKIYIKNKDIPIGNSYKKEFFKHIALL